MRNKISERWLVAGIFAGLVALVWFAFGQSSHFPFVNYDDPNYITENPAVIQGLSWRGLIWAFSHVHGGNWHPLTTISHMLDCGVFGLRAGAYHFVNVLFHTSATIALFFVLRRLTGALWRSAFVAAIFAIHPMRVESVAWIAERKDVLSGVFFMLTLGAYLRYVRAPNVWRYVTMSIFLVGGLISKATFVTVPLVLLLLDYWPLRRANDFAGWRKLVREKIPLFVLAAAAAVTTMLAQTVTMPTLEQLPLLPRLKNAAVSLVIYLRQTFWPADLAVFYPHPHDQLNIWLVLTCLALLVAITVIAILVRKTHPYVLVGWLWFLILVGPVIGILQAGLQARADRFTYLPHIGITMLVAWTCADLTRDWRNRQLILGSVAGCVIAASMIRAFKQTTYWRDSISLWEHALAVTPDNQTAHTNLAAALWAKGRTPEANKHSRAAAVAHARSTLKDFPFDVPTHNDLGVLLIQNGDVRAGVEQWEISLQLTPDDGNALNNLAWVLATNPADATRDGKRAVELAMKATTLPGGNVPIVLRTLAAAYAESGDFSKAIDTAQHAIDLATAQNNTSLLATLRHEIELYQARTPYRESPPQ